MCISPLTLKRPREEWQTDADSHSSTTRIVPCGKCYKCLGRRRNAWSFRLYHESQISHSTCFMTLTYGINEKDGFGENPPTSFNGIDTLSKRDFQLFMKKLRKRNTKKLKYYAVGEYGTNNLRPHYHVILYNLDSKLLYNSLSLSKDIWTKGNVDIAVCNIASINYVVGYLMKGSWQPQTDDDDRQPEFSLMSKKLGSSYLTDTMYDYHLERMETSANHPSGFKIPLPRYFKDQIFSKEEKAELYEINQQIQKMNWDEFINIDFKHNNEVMDYNIKRQAKKLKNLKTTL